MKIMVLASKHACNIFSTINGVNDLCGKEIRHLDIAEHIQSIMLGVGEECAFDRSLYGEANLYGLADDISKAFGVNDTSGWLDSVLLLDHIGTVAIIFGA